MHNQSAKLAEIKTRTQRDTRDLENKLVLSSGTHNKALHVDKATAWFKSTSLGEIGNRLTQSGEINHGLCGHGNTNQDISI